MIELENLLKREMCNEDTIEEKRFKIAFSFPGEYRDLVDKIAKGVASVFSEECILYDWFHRAEFARPNLDIYLQNLYKNESELIVIFICTTYNRKKWCGIEWRAIRELLNNKEADNRILFIKCGEGEVDGVFGSVDGYIDSIQIPVESIIKDIVSRYYLIVSANNANIMCKDDYACIQMLTPLELFNALFGNSSTPFFIVDNSICKNPSTFYKFILPQRIIEINPKIWESSARRSRLFNSRREVKYIEKMYYSLCYEKQIHILIQNCQDFINKFDVIINFDLFEKFINKIIYNISVCQSIEKQKQKQNHPGVFVASDLDLTSLFYYLKRVSIKDNIAEILSMLIAFSFLYEKIGGLIFHYEHSSKRVVGATAWMMMPMYADDDILLSTYMAMCGEIPKNAIQSGRINYSLICMKLKEELIESRCAIRLDSFSKLEHLDGCLVLINGSFLLEDLYAEGQHLKDFQGDIFKLLDIEQNKFTFMFSFSNDNLSYVKMLASGSKFNIRLAHLLQVIYESNRIFPLSIIGYLQAVGENCYSIKPLVIGYDSEYNLGVDLYIDS